MKTYIRLITTLFILLAILSCATENSNSSGSLKNSIDSLSTSYVDPHSPGFSILIMKQGKELVRQGYGLANLELSVPNDPKFVYKIGSLTKQFTATAILKLEEEGKLDLQGSIQKYLGDYPNKGYNITVENLLNHTSGIPNFTDRPDISELEKTALTPEQITQLFKDLPLDFPPGTQYAYSDSNYTLLGLIIEKLSNSTYTEYLKENLFLAAGLNNTFIDNPEILINNRISGYSTDSIGNIPAQFMSMKVPFAAGNIISNVDDLYSWTKSLHTGKVISQSQVNKMFTSGRLSSREDTGYGFGTFIKSYAGEPVYYHDGWIFGFISSQFYFPQSDLFVCVLSNSTSIDSHEIASKTVAILYNLDAQEAVEQLMWY